MTRRRAGMAKHHTGALLAVIGLAVVAVGCSSSEPTGPTAADWIANVNTSLFQSVEMTTGQIFYGHLSASGDVVVLSNVYYVTAPTSSAPLGEVVPESNAPNGASGAMRINPLNIVSVSNVGAGSAVAKAIDSLKPS
jgi:hypothetical protein